MSGIAMEMEIIPVENADHPKCLRCHRALKNPKWRKLGFGRKCYAKHCQETQQTLEELEKDTKSTTEKGINQERAPDPKISRAEKRAALEKAHQEEMARKDPAPTAAQKRATEQKLMSDVDKALGLEEDCAGESDSGEPTKEAGPVEETQRNKKKKKVGKVPEGQTIVRSAAFNRSGRSIIVNGRNNRA